MIVIYTLSGGFSRAADVHFGGCILDVDGALPYSITINQDEILQFYKSEWPRAYSMCIEQLEEYIKITKVKYLDNDRTVEVVLGF